MKTGMNLLFALAAGCAGDSPVAPRTLGSLQISTDSARYQFIPAKWPVAFVVTNSGDAPVSLAACGTSIQPLVSQREQSGEWGDPGTPSCPPGFVNAVVIAPGASIEIQVNFLTLGVYRVRVPVLVQRTHVIFGNQYTVTSSTESSHDVEIY